MNYDRYAITNAKDKGGVGASTAASAIATVLVATGGDQFETRMVDADGFNATLTQRMGQRDTEGRLLAEQDPAKGVIKADLFDEDGVRPIFSAVESDAKFVVIDTPAGALTRFGNLSPNLGARDFVEHCRACEREPIVMLPMTPAAASIRGIGRAIDSFGEDVSYVAIRNMVGVTDKHYRLYRTEPMQDQYGRWVGGRVRGKFEGIGGRVIDAPCAEAGTFAVAEALNLSFAEAARYKGSNWETFDRLNMQRWLQAWVAELRKIEDLLGLTGTEWRPY